MQLANSAHRYGALPKTFHWLTVGLVLLGWLLGTFGDDLPSAPARATGLVVHISAGLWVLMLLIARLAWRLADAPPAAETTPLGRWGDRAGKLIHLALYGLLAVIPVLGIIVQFGRGNALPIFGLFEIASPWPADRAFAHSVKDIHGTLADIIMVLALFHAAAALLHHYVFRDRTLRRMLPGTLA